VTQGEVFEILLEAFGLDSVLEKYESLEPLEGLKEAVSLWDWAKGIQDRVASDSVWFEYENHKTLAYVLMGVYCRRVLGQDDFPPLPDASPEVLRDPHALLCLWSRCLILDHVHSWQDCHHGATERSPAHPQCKMAGRTGSEGLSHIICGICGEERYDPQPMLDRAHKILRERSAKP
jgi:hypothetical protein